MLTQVDDEILIQIGYVVIYLRCGSLDFINVLN